MTGMVGIESLGSNTWSIRLIKKKGKTIVIQGHHFPSFVECVSSRPSNSQRQQQDAPSKLRQVALTVALVGQLIAEFSQRPCHDFDPERARSRCRCRAARCQEDREGGHVRSRDR